MSGRSRFTTATSRMKSLKSWSPPVSSYCTVLSVPLS
jgi:hypothetical protein